MRKSSSLTEQQRVAVLALFKEGYGARDVATHLRVGRSAVKRLETLWRVRGDEALMARSMKQTYPVDMKLEIVQRYLAGETKVALAHEYGMPSPNLVATWARTYRREGADGLHPKPKGRPRKDPNAPKPERTELERLQEENEYLRVENAYLKKLKALRAREQQ